MLNIEPAKITLFVIYFIPIPIEKLSNETKNENITNLLAVIDKSCVSFSFNKSIKININIKISMTLVSKLIILLTYVAKVLPNIGREKWRNPTNKEVSIIFLFGIDSRPYASESVKASILKDTYKN